MKLKKTRDKPADSGETVNK